MEWLKSYQKVKLDTPSETIEEGFYAIINKGENYIVQEKGEQPKITDSKYDISNLTQANVVGDDTMGDLFINEFKDEFDVTVLDKVVKAEYEDLGKEGGQSPIKK